MTRRPISAGRRGLLPRRQGYPAPPPQPQGYPPQPGPWGAPPQPRGGGFLQNAASTAAGVAGGVALGNLLGGLFGGHAGGGLFGGSGVGGAGLFGGGVPGGGNPTEVTEINNFYEDRPDRGSDANFQQFDPDAPGVQDANFDDPDLRQLGRLILRRRRRLRRRLRLLFN